MRYKQKAISKVCHYKVELFGQYNYLKFIDNFHILLCKKTANNGEIEVEVAFSVRKGN